MAKAPKQPEAAEGDPKRGDQILRRMLKMKPKPHKEMVKGRSVSKKNKVVSFGLIGALQI